LSLKTNIKIVTIAKNKTKIIFQIYFSFLSIVSINNIKSFIYLILINNNKIVLKRKITKATYKAILDKILEINDIINRALK